MTALNYAANNNKVDIIYILLLKEKEISDNLFSNNAGLKQIVIPSSVTSIGKNAFNECSSLTQIIIPSSVTSIGECAFAECSSLTQITIPSSITSIGECAFAECSSLTQIAIPSSITSIGNGTFSKCYSLKQITIPSSVTSIGSFAFFACSSLTEITIPSSVTSIGNDAFMSCCFDTFYLIANQFLDSPDQQKNGLDILNSIVHDAPDEELENMLEIASKFLFNENKEIRFKSFELIDNLVMYTLETNILDEEISELIAKYSEFLFKSKKIDTELENFIEKVKEYFSCDVGFDLTFMIEKAKQMVNDSEIQIDFRMKYFSLIEASISKSFILNSKLLPIALQLALEVCENDRLNDDYLFCESFFKRYALDDEKSIDFFKESIDKLFESKKLSDHQMALLLIKASIASMHLNDCVNYIDLILKIGDCEDEQIIKLCIAAFKDFSKDFNESLVIKFGLISEFLLKNKNNSDSLIVLRSLIKNVHKPPSFFTHIIDTLILILNSQEKSKSIKEIDVLKCINSCFSSGITSISPFDKPLDSATKVFEIIMERMNSDEFKSEVPIILRIFGNLVFCTPELIKTNLDEIMKVCQLNLKNSNILESSKCIRKIALYLPDSIKPYLPDIVRSMLEFISMTNPRSLFESEEEKKEEEKEKEEEKNKNIIKCIFKVFQCLSQVGLENDELAAKYDKELWETLIQAKELFVVFAKSANFFAKRGFPICEILSMKLDNLAYINTNDLCSYLKAIQQLILYAPIEQVPYENEFISSIGNTLVAAGTGAYTNLCISEEIPIIPDKLFRSLFDCLIAYVNAFQTRLIIKIDAFIDGFKADILNISKLSCVQFLHFLSKTLMICSSEIIYDEVFTGVFKNVLLNFVSIKKEKIIDTEKFAHVLISLIYIFRARNELLDFLKQKDDLFNDSLIQIEPNDDFEFIIIRQAFILNVTMLLELPIDDKVKKILNEIRFIKNMEVLPLLADCFIYIFKIIGDDILSLLKKFATIVFSSEKYVLELIDNKTLQFYSGLMKSIKQEELLTYTNLNESSIHQISFNMKKFST